MLTGKWWGSCGHPQAGPKHPSGLTLRDSGKGDGQFWKIQGGKLVCGSPIVTVLYLQLHQLCLGNYKIPSLCISQYCDCHRCSVIDSWSFECDFSLSSRKVRSCWVCLFHMWYYLHDNLLHQTEPYMALRLQNSLWGLEDKNLYQPYIC